MKFIWLHMPYSAHDVVGNMSMRNVALELKGCEEIERGTESVS